MFVIPFGFFGAAAYDDDAQAFFDAVEGGGDTLTVTEKTAVNTLVIDLKGYGLWTNMDVFYPFVGGTSTSTKWNLKDPRDLDAAHRINWYGSITYTNGVQSAAGSSDYGWTNYNPNTYGTDNENFCFGGYSLTDNTSNGSMMGAESPGDNWAFYEYFNGNYMLKLGVASYQTGTSVGTDGLFIAGAFSNTHKVYRNGSTQVLSSGTAPDNFANADFTILGNSAGASEGNPIANVSDRKYSFIFLYDGAMDSSEQDNFYTAATTFNSTLSR